MRHRLVILLTLLLAACGGVSTETTDTSEAPETTAASDTTAAPDTTSGATSTTSTDTSAATATGTLVTTAESDLGEILVDSEGRTLYVFDNDTGDQSSCNEGCAETWPALVTEGNPGAGGSADVSLLGNTERQDGSIQVTYDGRPLYIYSGDSAPGDTNGHGVGGVWWAVSPSGDAIQAQTGLSVDY